MAYRNGIVRILCLVVLALIWELVSQSGWVSSQLLPPLSEVTLTAYQLIQTEEVQINLASTMIVVFSSFITAVIIGIPVGILIVSNSYWKKVLMPFVMFPLGIPKSIFLPVFLLVFGIGFGQKFAFGVFSAIFLVIMNCGTAISSVQPSHLFTARAYGASMGQISRYIYLPAMLPTILEGLRLTMIFTQTGVILAEMYASRTGVGTLLNNWGEAYQISNLLAGILLISFFSICINEAFIWFERRLMGAYE